MDNRNDLEQLTRFTQFPTASSVLSDFVQPDLGIAGQAISGDDYFRGMAQQEWKQHQRSIDSIRDALDGPVARMIKEQSSVADLAAKAWQPAVTIEPPQPAWKSMVEDTLGRLDSLDGARQAIESITKPALEAAQRYAQPAAAAYLQQSAASLMAHQVVDDWIEQSRQIADSILNPLREQHEQWISSVSSSMEAMIGVQPLIDEQHRYLNEIQDWQKSLAQTIDPNDFLTSAVDRFKDYGFSDFAEQSRSFLHSIDSATLRGWAQEAATDAELSETPSEQATADSDQRARQWIFCKGLLRRFLCAFLPTKDAKQFHPVVGLLLGLLLTVAKDKMFPSSPATMTAIEHHETIDQRHETIIHQETIVQIFNESTSGAANATASNPSDIAFRPVLRAKHDHAALFGGFGGTAGVVTRLSSDQWLRVLVRQGDWIEVIVIQASASSKAIAGWIRESDTMLVPPEDARSLACGIVENDQHCD